MKKKICFIINPISGIGKQKSVEKLLQQRLNKALFDYDIRYTEAPKHATELAKKAVEENFHMVVAVGGDGSINETAKGLVNTTTAMGIIPAGSGNGLARHLGISLNLTHALDTITKGHLKTIDTVTMNDDLFVNVGGVGFDAHIGWVFSNYGKRGLSSYIRLVLQEFSAFEENEFELLIDGKQIVRKAFLITFANGSQWGNNFFISPNSVNDDGFFEVVILKNVSALNFIPLALKLLFKKIHLSKHCETYKAKDVIITQKRDNAHIDGEAIKVGNTVSLKINPGSLKIACP